MRDKIEIKQHGSDEYLVTVIGEEATKHLVRAPADYCRQLGNWSAEALIKASVDFLLTREPNTTILKTFTLADIAGYFPDYEQVMTDLAAKEI
ncbi:MAG: hypothetical protein WDZ85_00520 [Candidatus Paceibacterota bacterium]